MAFVYSGFFGHLKKIMESNLKDWKYQANFQQDSSKNAKNLKIRQIWPNL